MIYYNFIVYLILTTTLIYLFVNEKKIENLLQLHKIKFSKKIITKFNIKNQNKSKLIINFVNWTENIISILILVFIIQNFYIGNFLVPTGSMIPTIKPKDRLFGDMLSYKFIKPKRGDIIVFKEPLQNKFLFTKRLIAFPGEEISIKKDFKLYINGEESKNEKLQREYYQMELSSLMGNKTWTVPKKGDYIQLEKTNLYFEMGEEILDINAIQNYISENPQAVKEIMPHASLLLNGEKETGPILDFMYQKENLEKLLNGEKIFLDEDYYFVLGDNSANSLDSRYWGFLKKSRIKGRPFLKFWPLNRFGILK